LVKLLLVEGGSDETRALWNLDPSIATSWITFPEAVAAIGAAERSHRVTPSGRAAAESRLDELWENVTAVATDASLARGAGFLARRHSLRGMDAVHLATALELGRGDPVLVTWDRDLARAARAEGLAVAGIKG
jgi:uncharacterized protein